MSTQQPTHFVKGFQQGITHLAEQKTTRFRAHVRTETLIAGEENFFDQVGAVTATRRTGRHTDTEYTDTPQSRRKLISYPYDHADLIDKPDMLRVMNDPTNAFSIAFGRAFGRATDDEIIAAFFATAFTGKTGTGTETHDSNFQIAHGSVGLTLTKLITANRMLRAAENDPDEGFKIGVSQEQVEDLLLDSTFTSADYTTIRALMTGAIHSFMGLDWVFSERLDTDGSTARYCPAWAKNSMLFGALKEYSVRIDELPTKNYSTQVFASNDMGATRMDNTGVVRIACTE